MVALGNFRFHFGYVNFRFSGICHKFNSQNLLSRLSDVKDERRTHRATQIIVELVWRSHLGKVDG